jgi:hypothetical protein
MAVKRFRWWMWLVAFVGVVGVVGAIVALNWQWVSLTAAFVLAERRPALLADAQWNDSASAHQFSNRFRSGTSERELLEWLEANRFIVDPGAARARRLIHSLPCNESVEITWSRASGDKIAGARAVVHEAGCL